LVLHTKEENTKEEKRKKEKTPSATIPRWAPIFTYALLLGIWSIAAPLEVDTAISILLGSIIKNGHIFVWANLPASWCCVAVMF